MLTQEEIEVDKDMNKLRRGKWDPAPFLDYPNKEDALKILRLYADKYSLNASDAKLEEIYEVYNKTYEKDFSDESISVYLPSEIKLLVENISDTEEINDVCILKCIEKIKPIKI